MNADREGTITMHKIAVAALAAATVTATMSVTASTPASADWSDVRLVRDATVDAFYEQSRSAQRRICLSWRTNRSIMYRLLLPAAIKNGITRYDGRYGIRLAMNRTCPTYFSSRFNPTGR